MDREQALNEYEEAGCIIRELEQKRSNLKRIILAQVLPPQREIPRTDRFRSNQRSRNALKGATQQIVLNILAEHGEPIGVNDLTTLAGVSKSQVYNALSELRKKHLIHSELDPNSQYASKLYSSAIKPDQLNGPSEGKQNAQTR